MVDRNYLKALNSASAVSLRVGNQFGTHLPQINVPFCRDKFMPGGHENTTGVWRSESNRLPPVDSALMPSKHRSQANFSKSFTTMLHDGGLAAAETRERARTMAKARAMHAAEERIKHKEDLAELERKAYLRKRAEQRRLDREHRRREAAAKFIQQRLRGHQRRNLFRQIVYEKRRRATEAIENWRLSQMRMRKAHEVVKKMKYARLLHKKCIMVQTAWRNKKLRGQAKDILTVVRQLREKDRQRVVGVKRGAAAIKIQARFRGMRGRMRVKEEMIRAQKEADQLVKAHARLQALKPQSTGDSVRERAQFMMRMETAKKKCQKPKDEGGHYEHRHGGNTAYTIVILD